MTHLPEFTEKIELMTIGSSVVIVEAITMSVRIGGVYEVQVLLIGRNAVWVHVFAWPQLMAHWSRPNSLFSFFCFQSGPSCGGRKVRAGLPWIQMRKKRSNSSFLKPNNFWVNILGLWHFSTYQLTKITDMDLSLSAIIFFWSYKWNQPFSLVNVAPKLKSISV